MDRVRIFTSESVTEGHPDKICDQISDAILDAILEQDKDARVACETLATTGLIMVAGEVTTSAYVDIDTIVRKTVDEIGYNRAKMGFDAQTCGVMTSLKAQSPDIAQGVDSSQDESSVGAGDQGMMFGFACDETDDFMPMPIYLAHKLTKQLTKVRKDGDLVYLRPDGKAQVSVEYVGDKVSRVRTVVVSTQHSAVVPHEQLVREIKEHVILKAIPAELLDDETEYFVNPTGRFVIGGPQGDCGLTGRKIIVDTYGGYASHGGGAFSGKDPTKVDRSGAYMARYIAKNIVGAGIAKQCEIEIAYAIGVSKPVSILVNTHETGIISDQEIEALVKKHFDCRPASIIAHLDLKRPIYRQIAAYGHFGRNELDLPWEKLDKVEELKQAIK